MITMKAGLLAGALLVQLGPQPFMDALPTPKADEMAALQSDARRQAMLVATFVGGDLGAAARCGSPKQHLADIAVQLTPLINIPAANQRDEEVQAIMLLGMHAAGTLKPSGLIDWCQRKRAQLQRYERMLKTGDVTPLAELFAQTH